MLLEEATLVCIQSPRSCIYEPCRAGVLRSRIGQPMSVIVVRCPVQRPLTNTFSEADLECIEASLAVRKSREPQYHIF